MGEYLFTLPDGLIACLRLRTFGRQQDAAEPQAVPQEKDAVTSLGCSACQITAMPTVAAQRLHFKSDWHRYNLKHKQRISEEAFERLQGDDLSSISGSDSSLTSPTASSSPKEAATNPKIPGSPLVWFTAGQDRQIGLYKVALPIPQKQELPAGIQQLLQRIQVHPMAPVLNKKQQQSVAQIAQSPATDVESRKWAILMMGGGHFAGMIVSLVPKIVKVSGKLEKEVVILASKTFHRYTTRRKQGGAQSTNDQAKSKAKSAGAQIRRYNEQALQQDIRDLLASWSKHIQEAEAIFLRSSKQNSKIIFNYDEAILQRSDARIKTIPFPTRRPTLSELRRVFDELSTLKVSHLTDQALAQLEKEYLENQRKLEARLAPKTASIKTQKETTPALPTISPEEARTRARWMRLLDMVTRNRVDAFISFVEARQADAAQFNWTSDLPNWHIDHSTYPTLLHYASANDAADVVRYLLLDCKEDPARQSVAHKTPYELAPTKYTRNVYRRLMADKPDLCDWSSARVPSALTEEQEALQKDRTKERKLKLKERQKERDEAARSAEVKQKELEAQAVALKLKEEQAQRINRPNGAQKLGGIASGKGLGMSEEARIKLERERRARAAEARMAS